MLSIAMMELPSWPAERQRGLMQSFIHTNFCVPLAQYKQISIGAHDKQRSPLCFQGCSVSNRNEKYANMLLASWISLSLTRFPSLRLVLLLCGQPINQTSSWLQPTYAPLLFPHLIPDDSRIRKWKKAKQVHVSQTHFLCLFSPNPSQ